MTYHVDPDMAVFGKALGNGYPITAILGRTSIMQAAQESFISSTFWTERIGFVAALATLEKMKKCRVQSKLIEHGKMIRLGLMKTAQKHGVKIQMSGVDPLLHLSFVDSDALARHTFYTQEMLKKGFLIGGAIFTSYAYNSAIIKKFLQANDEVFEKISSCARKHKDIRQCLEGPVKHSGFKRLV